MNEPQARPEAPLDAARRLAPAVAAAAAETERERELPAALARALADAGLFRLLVPRSLGGAEMPLPEYIEVVEVIAGADASTGWCVNQGAVFATNSAFLPKPVARDLWSEPRMVIANGPSPTAEAVVVEGGYRVSGRWTFSSGCRHAPWLAGLAFVVEDGERRRRANGQPEIRHMLLPKDKARVLDTWQVRGLRGTGSHHFEVEDLFVPAAHTVWNYGDPVQESGPLYVVPMVLLFACGFASVAVGTARAALDALLEMAGAKTPRGAPSPLRDQPLVQMQVGEAEAAWRGARAYLHAAVGEVWRDVAARGAITLEQRAALRLAATHTIRTAAGVVDRCYTAAGSDAIYDGHPIQRRFQDIHVITQHVQGRLAHYESVGRYHLGLKPDKMWL